MCGMDARYRIREVWAVRQLTICCGSVMFRISTVPSENPKATNSVLDIEHHSQGFSTRSNVRSSRVSKLISRISDTPFAADNRRVPLSGFSLCKFDEIYNCFCSVRTNEYRKYLPSLVSLTDGSASPCCNGKRSGRDARSDLQMRAE